MKTKRTSESRAPTSTAPDADGTLPPRSEYRKLYDRRAWRRRSKAQLSEEPLCKHCLERGIVKAADHADHVIPHRGDEELFWYGELQSLCHECHSTKTVLEQGGKPKRPVSLGGIPAGMPGWDDAGDH